MMRIVLYLLFVFCLTAKSIYADTTMAFFDDAKKYSENIKNIKNIFNDIDKLSDSSIALLQGYGYLDAFVDIKKNENDYIIHIYAGQKYYLNKIIINNDTTIVTANNVPFDKVSITQIIDSLLSEFQDHGYYYCQIYIDSLVKIKTGVYLYLNISQGPLLKLNKLRYEGLSRTKTLLLDKYFNLESNLILNDDAISNLTNKAHAIPFVKFRPPLTIVSDAGYTSFDAELTFDEMKAVYFEGGGGITPEGGNKYFLSIDLRFNNLFGGGRTISVVSRKPDNNRNSLDFNYTQPLFLMGIGELRIKISSRDYRNTFSELSGLIGYKINVNSALRSDFSIRYKSVVDDIDTDNYKVYGVSLGFLLGQEKPIMKYDFFNTQWDISFVHRVTTFKSLNETRVEINGIYNKYVFKNASAAFVFSYAGLETEDKLLPLSEKIFIGGPGTLRGYRNEQFSVIRAGIITVEPAINFNNLKLFVFTDAGYLNDRVLADYAEINVEEKYKTGYGLGMEIYDQNKSVNLSLGWNPEVKLNQPRLAVNISSEF